MKNSTWHEHFFSPNAPEDEHDGRFDAVERDDGKCFVYHLGEKRYEPAANRDEAMKMARRYTAAWVPKGQS